MGMAAGAIGNTELEEKFAKSLEMLERPNTVVFNPSYVVYHSVLLASTLTFLDFTCNSSMYSVFSTYALHDLAVLPTRPLDFEWDNLLPYKGPADHSCRPIYQVDILIRSLFYSILHSTSLILITRQGSILPSPPT
jgi:hypothetical protein